MPNSEINAIVFDLDGTLVDSEPIHFRAANRVLTRYGVSISEESYHSFVGRGDAAAWQEWRVRFAIPDSIELLTIAHIAARLEEISAGVVAIDEAVALARRLSSEGYPLGVASSSTRAVMEPLLQALGLGSVFKVRVSEEDPEVRHGKPEPDIYLLAAARLGVAPAECLAIEDSGPGVTAAKRAGMTCIAVPNRWTAAQDFRDADVVLESLCYFWLLVL